MQKKIWESFKCEQITDVTVKNKNEIKFSDLKLIFNDTSSMNQCLKNIKASFPL